MDVVVIEDQSLEHVQRDWQRGRDEGEDPSLYCCTIAVLFIPYSCIPETVSLPWWDFKDFWFFYEYALNQ
jgi:hypothetical protein